MKRERRQRGRRRNMPGTQPDRKRLEPAPSAIYQRIYRIVERIPEGRVATYGQIARLGQLGGGARQVGYALRALHDDSVPWHRVINAQGQISPRAQAEFVHIQRRLLEAEGVWFDRRGCVPLERFQWRPLR